MLVSEILALKGKVLYTIAPHKMLNEAVAVMTEQDVGSLVVFEHGHMVGMLTFREVFRAVNKAGDAWQTIAVAEVMIPNPVVGEPRMDLHELRRHMIDEHQRYLPIMDEGTLLGVISFHDVAKAVLEEQSFENRMLKNYIKNWPEDQGNPD